MDKKSQDSSGKDKSDDIGHQGQVLMMVWAGNDGEEVENQGVAAEVESLPLPGSSVESEEFSVNPLLWKEVPQLEKEFHQEMDLFELEMS